MKRNDREEPVIPPPSADEVDTVIAAGEIGTEKRKDVEEGLACRSLSTTLTHRQRAASSPYSATLMQNRL